MTPTSKPAVTPEMVEKARQKFEEFGRKILGYDSHDFRRDDLGRYHYVEVQSAWQSWNASAASAVQDAVSECERIVVHEIVTSTGPTNGWLDSPKALTASILAALREKYGVKP